MLEVSDEAAAAGLTGLPRLRSGEDITPGRTICVSCKEALALKGSIQCPVCFLAGKSY